MARFKRTDQEPLGRQAGIQIALMGYKPPYLQQASLVSSSIQQEESSPLEPENSDSNSSMPNFDIEPPNTECTIYSEKVFETPCRISLMSEPSPTNTKSHPKIAVKCPQKNHTPVKITVQ